METDSDGVNELSMADDFVALCKLGHPLDQVEGVLAEIGDVHRIDVQCPICATVFVFKESSDTEWRLVESSDPMIAEHCATKRMRIAMLEEQRRMRFEAHWQRFATGNR